MESGLDGVLLVGKDDELLDMIIAAQQGRAIGAIPFVLPARDDELLDVALAIDAAKFALAGCLGPDNKEFIADVLALHGIVHDAIPVRTIHADASGLVVNWKLLPFEAALEFVQRFAPQPEQERYQCHPNRNAVGRLFEIDGAAVGIEGGIQFADARQWMHHAGFRVFRRLQEFAVDPGIGLILFGPALLLKTRHIDGIDLFVGDADVRFKVWA